MNAVMTRVAIVQTNVFGVLAYHWRCLECGQQSKRFDKEQQAAERGAKHACHRPGR